MCWEASLWDARILQLPSLWGAREEIQPSRWFVQSTTIRASFPRFRGNMMNDWWMCLIFLTCLFLPSHRCLISLKLGGKGLVAAVQSRQLMFMVPFVLGFSLLLYQEWGHTRCFGKRKGQLVTAHSRAPCTALPPAVYSSIKKRDSSDLRRCWTPSLSFWCFQTFISAVYLSTRQDHLISNPT